MIYHGESFGEHEAQVISQGRETGRYSHLLPESIRIHAEAIDERLARIRVCDPAVGSGAFPVGMMGEIVRARFLLETFIKKGKTLYDFKRECIENSLYGVDIDPGAVEIAKLRLWLSLVVDEDDIQNIKPLPNLDYKIVCGNSLVGFPDNLSSPIEKEIEGLIHEYFNETNPTKKSELKIKIDKKIECRYKESFRAFGYHVDFDFKTVFSEVFREKNGFDVIIANPPYVRQEKIAALKQTLQKQFECFTGTCDLFVYFYEKGIRLLRNKGILVFISSNKYFRSGYGEKLRRYLAKNTRICQIIDFGDAPVFDALAYPSILVTQKTDPRDNQLNVVVWQLNDPVEKFEEIITAQSFSMRQSDLTPDGWRLENQVVLKLLDKLRSIGKPLGEYVNGKIFRGIITGLNEAFVVDRETRDRLIEEHASSCEVLKPFLRGRDVKRWKVEYADQYLIKIESSENVNHPWSGKSQREAECIFAQTYPAIYNYFQLFREKLIRREDQGKYYWELRSCTYYDQFEKPKIIYPNICKRNQFAWDESNYITNQKAFIISEASKYLLAILNSQVVMWLFTKLLAKLQNDFYEPSTIFMEKFPIPIIDDTAKIESLVDQILINDNEKPEKDISELEKEIDQILYKLYELTEEEIRVIEGHED